MLLRIAIFAFALLSVAPAQAAKKVALLIGNATYTSATATLRNPPNDVAAMKTMLESAEFDVTVVSNATRVSMSEALDAFSEKAHGAEVGMVYYSGHGIELDGTNYLVPVDAELKSDRSAKYEAVTLDDVIAAVSGATTLKLVLLDACRDNPFKSSMKRVATKGAPTRGLARVDTSDNNLLIGYATAPGAVASDGEGSNSPYAQALVRHLTRPGLEIESALRAVAKEVHGRTGGEQVPFKTGSLFETVMLGRSNGGNVVDIVPALETPTESAKKGCEGEYEQWERVKNSVDKNVVKTHLRVFFLCDTAGTANARLAALRSQDKVALNAIMMLDDPFDPAFNADELVRMVEQALLQGNEQLLEELSERGDRWSSAFTDAFRDHMKKRGVDKGHYAGVRSYKSELREMLYAKSPTQ